MKHKKDEATGLPEPLHEGGYFQITRAATPENLRLYYRIKRNWWFDRTVDWVLLRDCDELYVYAQVARLLDNVAAFAEPDKMKCLIGKYPPKRLGKEG